MVVATETAGHEGSPLSWKQPEFLRASRPTLDVMWVRNKPLSINPLRFWCLFITTALFMLILLIKVPAMYHKVIKTDQQRHFL